MNRLQAQTVAYLVKGFWEHIAKSGEMARTGETCSELDLMDALIDLASVDDALYAEHEKDNGLVWAYEVTEPFGKALAEYHLAGDGALPSEKDAEQMCREIINQANAGA